MNRTVNSILKVNSNSCNNPPVLSFLCPAIISNHQIHSRNRNRNNKRSISSNSSSSIAPSSASVSVSESESTPSSTSSFYQSSSSSSSSHSNQSTKTTSRFNPQIQSSSHDRFSSKGKEKAIEVEVESEAVSEVERQIKTKDDEEEDHPSEDSFVSSTTDPLQQPNNTSGTTSISLSKWSNENQKVQIGTPDVSSNTSSDQERDKRRKQELGNSQFGMSNRLLQLDRSWEDFSKFDTSYHLEDRGERSGGTESEESFSISQLPKALQLEIKSIHSQHSDQNLSKPQINLLAFISYREELCRKERIFKITKSRANEMKKSQQIPTRVKEFQNSISLMNSSNLYQFYQNSLNEGFIWIPTSASTTSTSVLEFPISSSFESWNRILKKVYHSRDRKNLEILSNDAIIWLENQRVEHRNRNQNEIELKALIRNLFTGLDSKEGLSERIRDASLRLAIETNFKRNESSNQKSLKDFNNDENLDSKEEKAKRNAVHQDDGEEKKFDSSRNLGSSNLIFDKNESFQWNHLIGFRNRNWSETANLGLRKKLEKEKEDEVLKSDLNDSSESKRNQEEEEVSKFDILPSTSKNPRFHHSKERLKIQLMSFRGEEDLIGTFPSKNSDLSFTFKGSSKAKKELINQELERTDRENWKLENDPQFKFRQKEFKDFQFVKRRFENVLEKKKEMIKTFDSNSKGSIEDLKQKFRNVEENDEKNLMNQEVMNVNDNVPPTWLLLQTLKNLMKTGQVEKSKDLVSSYLNSLMNASPYCLLSASSNLTAEFSKTLSSQNSPTSTSISSTSIPSTSNSTSPSTSDSTSDSMPKPLSNLTLTNSSNLPPSIYLPNSNFNFPVTNPQAPPSGDILLNTILRTVIWDSFATNSTSNSKPNPEIIKVKKKNEEEEEKSEEEIKIVDDDNDSEKQQTTFEKCLDVLESFSGKEGKELKIKMSHNKVKSESESEEMEEKGFSEKKINLIPSENTLVILFQSLEKRKGRVQIGIQLIKEIDRIWSNDFLMKRSNSSSSSSSDFNSKTINSERNSTSFESQIRIPSKVIGNGKAFRILLNWCLNDFFGFSYEKKDFFIRKILNLWKDWRKGKKLEEEGRIFFKVKEFNKQKAEELFSNESFSIKNQNSNHSTIKPFSSTTTNKLINQKSLKSESKSTPILQSSPPSSSSTTTIKTKTKDSKHSWKSQFNQMKELRIDDFKYELLGLSTFPKNERGEEKKKWIRIEQKLIEREIEKSKKEKRKKGIERNLKRWKELREIREKKEKDEMVLNEKEKENENENELLNEEVEMDTGEKEMKNKVLEKEMETVEEEEKEKHQTVEKSE